jgi:hypothetical protein
MEEVATDSQFIFILILQYSWCNWQKKVQRISETDFYTIFAATFFKK